MPQIDLYAENRLDRRLPCADLAAQLTSQLAGHPSDPAAADRIAMARAILGDPGKRQHYDSRLEDPSAPPWTLEELRGLASAPTGPSGSPASGKSGIASVLGSTRTLAVIAAALALVVALVVTLFSCSGSGSNAGGEGDKNTSYTSAEDFSCWVQSEKPVAGLAGRGAGTTQARWSKKWSKNGTRQPTRVIMLTDAYDLPPEFAPIAGFTNADEEKLKGLAIGQHQTAEKTIGVAIDKESKLPTVATFSREGQLIGTTHDTTEASSSIYAYDAEARVFGGYFRIEATNGIEIPAAANGDEKNKNFAWTTLFDRTYDGTVWLLLRGSSKLYKGTIYGSNHWSELGVSADVSNCRQQ